MKWSWPGPGRLLLLSVILRAPSFAREYLSDDEAIYAVIGRATAAGGRLYVDAADLKPPAIFWLYDLAHRVAGSPAAMALIHVATILCVWATALTLGAIARRVTPKVANADRCAALLYTVFTTTMMPFDSLAANTELWMMLPASAAMLLMFDAPVGAGRAIFAGLLLSMGALFKYQSAVEAPVLLGLALWPRGAPAAKRAGAAAALFVGLTLPWAATLALFRANGTLDEALFWFRFNFAYISAGSHFAEAMMRALVRCALVIVPAILLYGSAMVAKARFWHERNAAGAWVIAWAGVSALAVCVGGRFFGHYFHQLTAPLSVLAASVVATMANSRTRLLALAVPAAVFWVVAWNPDPISDRVTGLVSPDYKSVVAYLDSVDAERRSLCVWGNSPQLIAMAGRPMACRFPTANFVAGLSPATSSQTDPTVDASANVGAGMRERLELDLNQRAPHFILDASAGNVAYFGKFPIDSVPFLRALLARDYDDAGVVSRFRIYRRKPGI